jgi:ribose transport system permease protein
MKFGKELWIFVLILLLCVVATMMNGAFISPQNLQNTTRLIGIYGLFSLGMSLVIITGGIDLSVGSVFALLGVILSILMVDRHIPPLVACLLVVATAGFLGLIHGFLVTRVKLQPFVVTLCGLLFYRGLARFVTKDQTRGFADAGDVAWLGDFANGNLFGIPIPLLVLLLVAPILFVLLHRSVWGRYLFAVGRNEEASRYAGIQSGKIITSAYILCGLLCGIATIQIAFYTSSVSPSSHGNFYELYAIAAAVLGGCSLRGGEGSIIGVLLGATLLQVLRNLVNLLGIPSSLDFAVMGAVIMIGVLADQLLRQRKKASTV